IPAPLSSTLFPYTTLFRSNSDQVIWIVDSSKYVKNLGKFPLPVEVIPYGSKQLLNRFIDLGYNGSIRKSGNELYLTDSKNYIIRSEEHTSELQSRENLVCR